MDSRRTADHDLVGPLFDTVGAKKMISGTYLLSGGLLAVSGWLFQHHDLDATSQTFAWIVIFFFASAGAIAVFFAIAQIFGALGPVFCGALIGDGSSRTPLFVGYLIGAGIMMLGGVVEILFGINAEGKSLEDITKPLTATDQPPDTAPIAAPA